MTSFRGRVFALAVLIVTMTVSMLVAVSYVWLRRVTEADAVTLARTRAEAIAANVSVRSGHVTLIESGNEALDTIAWVYADGTLIDGAVPGGVVSRVRELANADTPVTDTVDDLLLYAQPIPIASHHVVVIVRVDLAPFESSEANGLRLSISLGLMTIVLAAALTWLVVRRATRVVHEMAALAEDWGAHDPGRRFNRGPPRDGFGQLAQTFDGLLDRVEAAIADERRLTDEIAHELRTPITALRGEAQLAMLSGDPLDPSTILHEVDRLNASVTTILDAARRLLTSESNCHLRQALRASIADRRVELLCSDNVVVAASADIVTSIVSPLLDNACRHARSRVQIMTRAEAQWVVVDILDDGPGFSALDVERVFDAGRTTGSGHGLGLALVRRLATAAGAGVKVHANGRGHVEVIFPTVEECPQSG